MGQVPQGLPPSVQSLLLLCMSFNTGLSASLHLQEEASPKPVFTEDSIDKMNKGVFTAPCTAKSVSFLWTADSAQPLSPVTTRSPLSVGSCLPVLDTPPPHSPAAALWAHTFSDAGR